MQYKRLTVVYKVYKEVRTSRPENAHRLHRCNWSIRLPIILAINLGNPLCHEPTFVSPTRLLDIEKHTTP